MAPRANSAPHLTEDGKHWLIGDRIYPAWIELQSGRRTPIIMGGSGDDDVDDDTSGDDNDDDVDDDSTGGGDDDSGTDNQDGDPEKKKLSDEAAKRRRQLRDAEKERDRLAAQLKKIEDADKSELERANARVQELEGENAALKDSLQRQALDNAFLKDNQWEWHDPEDVLIRLRGAESVSVNEEGEVEGLSDFLKNLAETKKHLVKPKSDDDSSDDGDKGTRRPSGTPSNGRKTKDNEGKDQAAKRKALQSRIPALRR